MPYKVCILAAGIGSRISSSNKIHKALLPLNDEAIITKIINKFPKNTQFVIAVGYNKDQIKDYILHAHSKNKIRFVNIINYSGPGSGPGFSLLQCKKYLMSPFIFTTSDTMVLENMPKTINKDWVGVAPVKETKEYCTFKVNKNVVTGIDDKTVNSNKIAFIGLAGVKNYDTFFKSLEENQKLSAGEIQVSSGLKGLINKNLSIENFTWYDTGNDKNYKITKEAFEDKPYDFSKPDEYFYLTNKKIIKLNADKDKVKNLSLRALKLKTLIPNNFKKSKNTFSYNYYSGQVFYDVANPFLTNKLLNFLDKNLWDKKIKISQNEFQNICHNFYKNKTFDRLSSFKKISDFDFDNFIINGKKVKSLNYYLNKINWKSLSEGTQSQFHGDLQFDNIIYSFKEEKFKLIDWRSDFGGNIIVGDIYYDLAKLYSGCVLQYNEIKKNNFDCNIIGKNVTFDFKVSYNITASLREIKKFIISNGYDLYKVQILSSLIFLNMSPLHKEPFSYLLFFLGYSSLVHSLNSD